MRYLTGLILAAAMLAAVYFGGGWGVARITAVHAAGGSLTSMHGLLGLAAVLGTGLLAGLLMAVPAVSPLGPGLAGVVLLGWSGLFAASASRALRYLPLPGHSFAAGFQTMLVTGVLMVLGGLMIVPLLVPSRWRRKASLDDEFTMPAVMARLNDGG